MKKLLLLIAMGTMGNLMAQEQKAAAPKLYRAVPEKINNLVSLNFLQGTTNLNQYYALKSVKSSIRRLLNNNNNYLLTVNIVNFNSRH